MNAAPLLERHPALRWFAPAIVVCLGALVATGVFRAGASSAELPRTTPAALLAAVRHSDVTGFSGTVVSQLSLGLPDLPALGPADDSTSFTSLLSGSHTMQVWYGGPTRQRVALFGATDETDVFRDGRNLWQWSSADQVAEHATLPAELGAGRRAAPAPEPTASSLTPVELARHLLGRLDPSTRVRVISGQTTADRSAYDLVLTPRMSATKVGSVHISVDGATKLPLGVAVYARGESAPSIDVSFTSIRFAAQPDRAFTFAPPSGATVRPFGVSEPVAHSSGPAEHASQASRTGPPTTSGSGWATVVRYEPGRAAVAKLNKQSLFRSLAAVSGPWGSGRLLDASLISVLVTDDGRVYAGAVPAQQLYAAAAK